MTTEAQRHPGRGTRTGHDATQHAPDNPYPTRVADRPALIERREPTVWGRAHNSGPHTAEQLALHARDGFSTVQGLVTSDEVAELAGELDRMAADPTLADDDRTIVEKHTRQVRSVFEVHRVSELIGRLAADERLVGRARQILGSEVYIHQSRINYKPGFAGGGFYWHSDFETWHAEDGMPRMRAVSVSVSLTDNFPYNGCLMIMPGSHRTFVSCVGETPAEHYRESLRRQEFGTPDTESLALLADRYGIAQFTGPAGSALFFDSNCMHGSSENITPFPRSNIFIVYNSVHNALGEPYAAPARRPEFVAAREVTPVGRVG
ncbi:MAG: ectoine hydroxylase [Pseudonocardia sp.]|jgi:ectoine hydroxylase